MDRKKSSLTDATDIQISDEQKLVLKYVPLEVVRKWKWSRNPKIHADEQIVKSIQKYGFQDPPKFDVNLNGGDGGLVEGNGRVCKALVAMKARGLPAPKNVAVHKQTGDWAIPVVFGNYIANESLAEMYAVDHNNLTAGPEIDAKDLLSIWETDLLTQVLTDASDDQLYSVSFDQNFMDETLAFIDEDLELVGSWDNEPKTPPQSHGGTTFKFGRGNTVSLPRDVYLAWLEDLKIEIGHSHEEIIIEIATRMGFDVED